MPLDTSTYYPDAPSSDTEVGKVTVEGGLFPEATNGTEKPQPPEMVDSDGRGENVPKPDDPETWLDSVCKVLSWVLVPLMMPVYGMLMIFSESILSVMPMSSRVTFTLIVFAFNVVVPMLVVVLLKRAGIVDDIGLNGRRERLIPYIITIICLSVTAVFMWRKEAPMWVVTFFAGGALAGIVNLMVNFRWKISAHSAGIAGIVAVMVRIIKDGYPEPSAFMWLIVWILLTGLLGGARVWQRRHTLAQVLAGYAVGFCSVFFLSMI